MFDDGLAYDEAFSCRKMIRERFFSRRFSYRREGSITYVYHPSVGLECVTITEDSIKLRRAAKDLLFLLFLDKVVGK